MESVNTMTLDAEKRTNVRYWIVVMPGRDRERFITNIKS